MDKYFSQGIVIFFSVPSQFKTAPVWSIIVQFCDMSRPERRDMQGESLWQMWGTVRQSVRKEGQL